MGGGGGKSGGGGGTQIQPDLAQGVYNRWYERGTKGWKYNPEGENLPAEYMQFAAQGYETGRQQQQQQQMLQSFQSAFAMPELPPLPEGPSYEEQLAEQQRQRGIQQRDELFSGYLDAASAAADYVNSEIAQEQANAKLLGIDYEITPDQRTQRINNYFATIWGEGQQTQLQNLMAEYGDPEGFSGWTVTRGDPTMYAATADEQAQEKTVGTTKGLKPILLGDEEETGALGGTTSILGV